MLQLLPWGAIAQLRVAHGIAHSERGFTLKAHLTALLFGQLSGAMSLREIETVLESHAAQAYHLGIGKVRRSTLSEANAHRPRAFFADLLVLMIQRAQRGLRRQLDGITYLIDSTPLALTAQSARWAHFSAAVCGAKAHIIYDPAADQPIYAAVSAANVNDITAAKAMPIVAGATYVFDLGYYDYGWWAKLDAAACRIVTRLKKNTPVRVITTRAVPAGSPILSDQVGYLPARQANSRKNPFDRPVREIQVQIETGKVLRIVTNDLTACAQDIADLYKRRWAIELFFRWIKQTLNITHFLGTSENAVCIQVAVALIAFILLRLAQAVQCTVTSPLAFARLVRANLLHRRDIRTLLPPSRKDPSDAHQLACA
jgi:transposase